MPATESNYRDVKKVHVFFAVSCVLMLFTTVWMMASDQAREWMGYQRTFEKLQTQKQEAAIQSIEKSPQFQTSKEELTARRDATKEQLKSIQPEIDHLTSELAETD